MLEGYPTLLAFRQTAANHICFWRPLVFFFFWQAARLLRSPSLEQFSIALVPWCGGNPLFFFFFCGGWIPPPINHPFAARAKPLAFGWAFPSQPGWNPIPSWTHTHTAYLHRASHLRRRRAERGLARRWLVIFHKSTFFFFFFSFFHFSFVFFFFSFSLPAPCLHNNTCNTSGQFQNNSDWFHTCTPLPT